MKSAKQPKPSEPQKCHRRVSVVEDPPRQNVLLLSCMDQRMLDDTVKYMNALNLQNRYDQVALAGGAMGAIQLPDPKLPSAQRWRAVFFIHLEKAINVLHRPIKDVFLLEHLDCGAYKYLHPDEQTRENYREACSDGMIDLHRKELKAFAAEVTQFIAHQKQCAEDSFDAAREACEACDDDEEQKEVACDDDEEQKKKNTCWEKVKDLAAEKVKAWSDIRVSYFVMDLIGKVTQLDVPVGERATLEK